MQAIGPLRHDLLAVQIPAARCLPRPPCGSVTLDFNWSFVTAFVDAFARRLRRNLTAVLAAVATINPEAGSLIRKRISAAKAGRSPRQISDSKFRSCCLFIVIVIILGFSIRSTQLTQISWLLL